jgi:serine/threonine-protein kinase
MNPSMPSARLGNYEPLLELASGGMGTVYVARQIGAAGFERLVVMKRVHRHHLGNTEFLTMLRDEAHLASLVKHPNVVPVIDVVEADGELALVMEYIESTALSSLVKMARADGDRIRLPILARILADALAGLHAAHEAVDMRGQPLAIIHRDVSPQNIIVGVDGTSRLIDFGVAKATHRLTQTRSDSLKGKLGYMAPEQIQGLEIDRRVDLFAMGVALHEAVTGRRLFHGDNDFDTMRRILEMPIPRPSNLANGISRELDGVILKSLAREPSERFQTAAEFLEALEVVMAPAPTREVAAYVKTRCGPRMSERRVKLRSLLEGQASPMTLPPVAPIESGPATQHTQGSLASTVAPSRRSGMPEPMTDSRIVITEGTMVTERTRSWAWPVALVAALFLLTVGVGVAAWRSRPMHAIAHAPPLETTSGVSAAPSSPATSPAATQTQAPAAPTEGIEIRVTAETTILRVSAVGMKRATINGETATIAVAPWTGNLEVEALLSDGREARVLADAKGSRDVRLQPVPKRTGSGSGKGTRSPRAPKTGPSATVDRGELHDNPY